MVRFKLTENQLSGYVIGFDKSIHQITKDSKFVLIDVFTVTHSGVQE